MKISVFLPARKGSMRVINKNTKPFAQFKFGLIELKLQQLLQSKKIEKIYLSTNDESILNFATSLKNPKILTDKREDRLCANSTTTDELILYVRELIQEEHILWTHATSPFFTAKDYDEAIESYENALKNNFDSLMSVTKLLGFFWNKKTAINYDRKIHKWSFTQDTNPIYEVNSAVFLASKKIYENYNDRIGVKPFFYETDKIKGFDIDYEEEFKIAELLLLNNKNLWGGGQKA